MTSLHAAAAAESEVRQGGHEEPYKIRIEGELNGMRMTD